VNRATGFDPAAIDQRCTFTVVYKRGSLRPRRRTMMRRLMLEVNGVVYVVADGYQSGCKKTFRLDRIRDCCLP
jgi:hypothetical protein